jgi:hypothetical protein
MQQGFSGAQTGFQSAANRASTAVRGYSQRFNNNGYGGNGGEAMAGFPQMSSANPQFGGSFNAPPMQQMRGNPGYDSPAKPMSQLAPIHDQDPSRCSRKTFLGLLAIVFILVGAGAGVGILFSLNDAKRNAAGNGNGLGAANGGNDTGNGTSSDERRASSGAFTIDIEFISAISSAQKAAFLSAKARWEQVIVGDLASEAILRKGAVFCGLTTDEDIRIDDVLIFVDITTIDGAGKILGSAGPCGFGKWARFLIAE